MHTHLSLSLYIYICIPLSLSRTTRSPLRSRPPASEIVRLRGARKPPIRLQLYLSDIVNSSESPWQITASYEYISHLLRVAEVQDRRDGPLLVVLGLLVSKGIVA